jgi:hypothetical protein
MTSVSPIFPGLWVRLCLGYSNNNKCIDIKPRQNGSLPFLWAIASTVTRQHFLPAAPCNNNPSPFKVARSGQCVYLALSVHGWLDSSQKIVFFFILEIYLVSRCADAVVGVAAGLVKRPLDRDEIHEAERERSVRSLLPRDEFFVTHLFFFCSFLSFEFNSFR